MLLNFIVKGYKTVNFITISRQFYQRKMNLSVKSGTTTFCMNDYDVIGFDLDHTICKYKMKALNHLIYKNMVNYLVKVKNYPPALFDNYLATTDFFQKGIIFDQLKGNFLKLADNLLILKAYHGTKQMKEDEIKENYGTDCIFKAGGTLISNFFLPKVTRENIHLARDYFTIPILYMCARIIDMLDQEKSSELIVNPYKFWPDVLCGLLDMFKREAFHEETGGYFKAIQENPLHYFEKPDEIICKWLKNLKKDKKVFLLTNSHVDIAEFLLENCVGSDWRDYFDLVISYARKPGFYTAHRPFLELKGHIEGDVINVGGLNGKYTFSQGNWEEMSTYFAKLCQKNEPKFLYFGDSVIDDVYGPANYTHCDTIAIVDEMASEGMNNVEIQYNAKEEINSTVWGSFFNEYIGGKQNLTLFGSLIMDHSVLAIPGLKSIASVPLDEKIPRFSGNGSLNGFFPAVPLAFKNA